MQLYEPRFSSLLVGKCDFVVFVTIKRCSDCLHLVLHQTPQDHLPSAKLGDAIQQMLRLFIQRCLFLFSSVSNPLTHHLQLLLPIPSHPLHQALAPRHVRTVRSSACPIKFYQPSNHVSFQLSQIPAYRSSSRFAGPRTRAIKHSTNGPKKHRPCWQ